MTQAKNLTSASTSAVPTHIGFILDGNRRWARSNDLPTLKGHRQGYDNLKTVAEHAFNSGVSYVSAYIFSTENWNRAKEEVDYLMQLALRIASKDAKQLIKKNIKILVLGSEDRVPSNVYKALKNAEKDSKNNTGGTLALCFNYGGQIEIADAVKKIVRANTPESEITPELVAQNLYYPELPAVDLMIRTSGEQRISNFMLWRIAYSELYFTEKYWPDFGIIELDKALEEYKNRNRRFGGN